MSRKLSNIMLWEFVTKPRDITKSVEMFNGKITSMIKIHFPLSTLRIIQSMDRNIVL